MTHLRTDGKRRREYRERVSITLLRVPQDCVYEREPLPMFTTKLKEMQSEFCLISCKAIIRYLIRFL